MNLLVQSISYDDLPDADDVLVSTCDHEGHDLSQARNGEPLFLLFELELFQSVDPARLVASGTKDDTVRPFLDVIQASVAVDGATGGK